MTDSEFCTYSGHTILCGWNEHAQKVLQELEAAGRQVAIVTERQPELPPQSKALYIPGSPNSDQCLEKAGVHSAAVAIILAERARELPADLVDSHSILTVLAVESLNRDVYTILEILNPENALHARRANVDDIVFCNKVLAEITASCSSQKGLAAVWDDILCHSDNGAAIRTEDLDASWQGRTIGELFKAQEAQHRLPLGYVKLQGESLSHSVNPPKSEIIALPMSVVFISPNA